MEKSWLKFRTRWAWGTSNWETIKLPDDIVKAIENSNKEKFEVFLEKGIHKYYNWSDKYRGIEYETVSSNEVEKDIIRGIIKEKEEQINYYKEELKKLKEDLGEDILDIPGEIMKGEYH